MSSLMMMMMMQSQSFAEFKCVTFCSDVSLRTRDQQGTLCTHTMYPVGSQATSEAIVTLGKLHNEVFNLDCTISHFGLHKLHLGLHKLVGLHA